MCLFGLFFERLFGFGCVFAMFVNLCVLLCVIVCLLVRCCCADVCFVMVLFVWVVLLLLSVCCVFRGLCF